MNIDDRILIVDVEDNQYILDKANDENIVYADDDLELEQPLGIYIEDINEITFIDMDTDEDSYIDLMNKHDIIRKIDPIKVENKIKELQMDGILAQSTEEDFDDVADEEPVSPPHIPVELVKPEPATPENVVGSETIKPTEIKDNEISGEIGENASDDEENIDPELADTTLLDYSDLAESSLSIGQIQKLSNIDIEKTITGQVLIKKSKEGHEVIYPDDILFSELVSTLQEQKLPASVANNLAEEYLNITEVGIDHINSAKDNFEKYKYMNPIIYNYLRNFNTKASNLPKYYKYWLIPIVYDIKKVYSSVISENQTGSMLSTNFGDQLSLFEEIKQENEILSRVYVKTDHEVNSAYVKSEYCYSTAPVGTQDLKENITSFENPDLDRQDYTIHVLRYSTIGTDRLELRKAYGAVYKVNNLYENMKKLTKPIIGLDHTLSVEGETVNVVGFLRLPIRVTKKTNNYNLQTILADIYEGKTKLKVYRTTDEIPKVSAENVNDIIAVIFPKDATLDTLENIFNTAIPNLQTMLQIYEKRLTNINNLEQLNQLLSYYSVDAKSLNEVSYNKLIQKLRDRVLAKLSAFSNRKSQLTKLFAEIKTAESKQMHVVKIISDSIIKKKIIVDNYGIYPDFGQVKDSDLNRLNWIHNQLDNGRLFYAVLNYLEINTYFLNLISAPKAIILDKLSIDQFKSYLSDLDRKMATVASEFKSAQEQVSSLKASHASTLLEANSITKLLAKSHKPLFYVSGENKGGFNPIASDFSNVYVLDGNEYVPQILYAALQKVISSQMRLATYQFNKHRIETIADVAKQLNETIEQSMIRFKLLQLLFNKYDQRDIKTDIKASDLSLPDQTILDLLNQIKNVNAVKAKILYLKLIDTYGMLSPDEKWIMSKSSMKHICCVHKKDQLLDKPLTKYEDSKNPGYCIICSEQIGEIDFDIFGGYDADDNPIVTHEGNVLDTHIADLAAEMAGQLVDTVPVGLNCAQFASNEFKKYACIVLKFMRETGQMKLNNDQLIDAVNLFYNVTKMTDLHTNINLDSSNKFIQQKMFTQYTDYYKGKKAPSVPVIKNLANASLSLSRAFDLYILTLVSAVIRLELSEPEKYLSNPEQKYIFRLSEQQTSNEYVNDFGKTIKTKLKTFANNMSQIVIDDIELVNSELIKIVGADAKLPYIGNLESVKISEYISKKFTEFYDTLIKNGEIAIKYEQAKKLIAEKTLLKPSEVKDPETLLIPISPITSFEYKDESAYINVLKHTNERLRYLDQLRVIKLNKLTTFIYGLIDNNVNVMSKIKSYPVNQECPIDVRQLYANYLLDLHENYNMIPKESKEDKKLELNLGETGQATTNLHPTLIHEEYKMSKQKEDFAQLEELSNDNELISKKTFIKEMDNEIRSLNTVIVNLQKKQRLPKIKNEFTKTSMNDLSLTSTNHKLYDPSKLKTWHTLSSPAPPPNPLNDTVIQSIFTNSTTEKIRNNINYLVTMLNSHLKHLAGYKSDKYLNILLNMGEQKQKMAEIKYNIDSMRNKANHKWTETVIAYIYKTEYFRQGDIIKRDLIKSYIYLVHYIVAILRNDFTVEVVPDINENIVDLISYFKDEAKDVKIFDEYKYMLNIDQLSKLMGVFTKDEYSLDKTLYMIPPDVNKLLHYVFVTELTNNLKSIYGITDEGYPVTNNQKGLYYCQFVIRILDAIDNLNKINDTSATEINNMFMAYMSKKAISYQALKNKMDKDALSIFNQQMKNKFKTMDSLEDPSNQDIYKNTNNGEKVTKEQKLDDQLNVAEDIAPNDIMGEVEDENPDKFGDDVSY